jgi:hypothetical protein
LTRNMSSGKEDQAGDIVGQKISHLARFNDKPKFLKDRLFLTRLQKPGSISVFRSRSKGPMLIP